MQKWNNLENLPFFMKCNPSMIYCRGSNLITSKGNWCLVKVHWIFLQKLKIGNTRSDVNQWELPDEFLPNEESLTNKTSIIKKYENMKRVTLNRIHQEDEICEIKSEISQLSTQTLFMIYSQPTPHLHSMAPSVPTSMKQPVSWSPRIHQANGHHMYYTNKGSMNTKTKTDTKLAKMKYLLSSLFLPFTKDKIRIKIW